MFYSRPAITPLNWDFIWLRPDGWSAFVGLRSDNRLVNFKYRNGWLQAWLSTASDKSDYKEQVLKERIGTMFHATMDVDQLADVLSLTVDGERVPSADDERQTKMDKEPVYDWSGATTYWHSRHEAPAQDISAFIEDIQAVFPESCLLQLIGEIDGKNPSKGFRRKCRQISFYVKSDEALTVAISYNKPQLLPLISSAHVTMQEWSRLIPLKIDFRNIERVRDPKELLEKYKSDELALNYQVQSPLQFHLFTHYPTDSKEGQQFMRELLKISEQHFFKNHQIIDLRTQTVLKTCNQESSIHFSISQRSWCLEKSSRYLKVGVETAQARANTDEPLGQGDETLFYGLRPI